VKSMTNKLLNKKTQEREKEWGDRETESQMGRLGDREIFQISDCGVRIAEFKKQDKEMEAMLPPTSGLRRTSLPGGRQGVRRSK
jgi:hypothetical protein